MTAAQIAPEWEIKATSPARRRGGGRKVVSSGRWVSIRPMQFGPDQADPVLAGDLEAWRFERRALRAGLAETAGGDDRRRGCRAPRILPAPPATKGGGTSSTARSTGSGTWARPGRSAGPAGCRPWG